MWKSAWRTLGVSVVVIVSFPRKPLFVSTFSSLPGRKNVNGRRCSFGNNGSKPPRPPPSNNGHNHQPFGDDGDDNDSNNPLAWLVSSMLVSGDASIGAGDNSQLTSATPPTSSAEQITFGAKSLLSRTIGYWRDRASTLFARAKRNKSKAHKVDEETLALQKVKIMNLTAPNSTILSDDSLRYAGQRANLIGNILSTSGVHRVAQVIKQEIYHRGKYPLCSVTGATLTMDGECRLQTEEPTIHKEPVAVAFAKEMVVDSSTNATLSFRQYRERRQRRKETNAKAPLEREDLNTTFVQTNGRTRPGAIAKALDLQEGNVFRWDTARWKKVSDSGIWDKVLHVEPVRLEDGTIQLRVICQESPPRRVEYGVSKSLYTGEWEGELDFENRNLLGGGECLSASVRRGARDPEPSILLKYQDEKFGQPSGYSVEAFQDYIGTDKEHNEDETDEVKNPLLTKRGVTFRSCSSPLATFLERSSASASFERVKTVTGTQEDVASTTLNMGPIVRKIRGNQSDARHSLLTTIATGIKTNSERWALRPYTTCTLLARQIFPVRERDSNTGNVINIAFRHSFTTSTQHLPLHEANAQGISARVRGYTNKSNGPLASAIAGTTELRLPFQLSRLGTVKLVLFADYLFAQRRPFVAPTILTSTENNIDKPGYYRHGENENYSSTRTGDSEAGAAADFRGGATMTPFSFFHKSSIGLGFRKRIQGIPVKCDFSLTQEGKIGSFLSIGNDFDVI